MPSRVHTHVSALIVDHAGALAALGVDRLRTITTVVLRPLPALAPASALVAGVSLDVEGSRSWCSTPRPWCWRRSAPKRRPRR